MCILYNIYIHILDMYIYIYMTVCIYIYTHIYIMGVVYKYFKCNLVQPSGICLYNCINMFETG